MYKHFFKRVGDIIIGLCALPFVLLFIVIVGPIIYFEDKGPIFYKAKRIAVISAKDNKYKHVNIC